MAAAIHNGHSTRGCIDEALKLDESERLREEDPYTAELAQIAPTQIVALRSRFEVDLNRPRDRAIYQQPEDAWGLDLWRSPLTPSMIEASLGEYDRFYRSAEELLRELVTRFGRVVVYDLHSYNHRRDGQQATTAEPAMNPEINVGTGTMDRHRWAPVLDRFIHDLASVDFQGRTLDVRENVKFQGGHFGRWIHQTFPESVCSIAIEVKKFFMDEWTGQADLDQVEAIAEALRSTLPGVQTELSRL